MEILCPKCHKSVSPLEERTMALDNVWHRACFVCFQCSTRFDKDQGRFFIVDEKALCVQCELKGKKERKRENGRERMGGKGPAVLGSIRIKEERKRKRENGEERERKGFLLGDLQRERERERHRERERKRERES